MIDCRQAAAHLYEFVDRELDGKTAAEIEEHLKCCGHCFDAFDLEAKIRELVREKAAHSPVADALKARILAELEKAAAEAPASPRRVWMWGGGAVAAAAVILLYIFGLPGAGGNLDPLVVAAAAEHQNHLAAASGGLPEGVSADSVNAVLKAQLGFDPEVNQLKMVGPNLKAFHAGAWSGKPAACLYLTLPDGDKVSMLLCKEAAGGMPKGKPVERNGIRFVSVAHKEIRMIFWEWDGMLCCVAGNCSEEDLLNYLAAA
jgi:anti-sigma factor (TIGR02949 family)